MRYRLHTDKGLLHFRQLLTNTNSDPEVGGYKRDYSSTSLPHTIAVLLRKYSRQPIVKALRLPQHVSDRYIDSTWCVEYLKEHKRKWTPLYEHHYRPLHD